jgi:deoxycytidylate deaminase
MRALSNLETVWAREYFNKAREEALKSLCLRSKCGTVIVKDDFVLGKGTNSPPGNKKLERCIKDSLPKDFKSDGTCCIHSEQRAIDDALCKFGRERIKGSTLYFTRINGDMSIIPVGKPYCTICSKIALDVGVSKWVLFHEDGFYEYDAEEYNKLSFGLKEWDPKNL